jgi:hypothetical protein
MTFEVIGNFVLDFHAQIRFCVTRLTSALVIRCTLNNRDLRATLERGNRGRHAANAAADDYHMGRCVRHKLLR